MGRAAGRRGAHRTHAASHSAYLARRVVWASGLPLSLYPTYPTAHQRNLRASLGRMSHRTITTSRSIGLPHWQVNEGTYFVTFRLFDALSADLARIRGGKR